MILNFTRCNRLSLGNRFSIACLFLFIQADGVLAQTPPVVVAEASVSAIIDRVVVSGTVVAKRASRISTDIGGLVKSIPVDIGDRVEANSVLVEFDSALAGIALDQAKAATRQAEEEVSEAQRRLGIAEELVGQNTLSRDELENRAAQYRISLASLERLKAEQAQQEERVRRHTLRAPFPGVVALKVTEEGEWVSQGMAVLELVDVDHLVVDAAVPQRYFAELDSETPATLQFEALPSQIVPASIDALVPVNDPNTRTFTLRLAPTSNAVTLAPGMSAKATLELNSDETGILLSRNAILRYPDGRTTVWVVDAPTGTATVLERQVTLGQAFDGQVHIKSGVNQGDMVVVRGNESLAPGDTVQITEFAD